MSVYVENCKKIYSGNGVAREWGYDFPLPDASYMEVHITGPGGTPVLLTAGYTVNIAAMKVVYPAAADAPALAEGWKLTLRRVVPLTQPIELPNQQGRWLAKNTEIGLDRLVMMIQQHNEILHRSLLFGVDFDGEVDTQNILNMVQFNHDSYPEIVEARNLCVDAKATVLPARDETLEYRNTAEALVNRALAASAEAWKANKIYIYPNVVAAPDGFSYRCISTTGVTNEYPPTSPYWCRLLVDLEEFFTWDNEGDLMPEAYPINSSKWSIDADGDIFPIY